MGDELAAAVNTVEPLELAFPDSERLLNLTGLTLEITEVAIATRTALETTWLAVTAWTRVLHLMAQPLGRLAVVAWPSIRSGIVTAARAAANQSRTALAIEAAVLICVIALWRFVTFVRRRRYFSRARAAAARRFARFDAHIRRRSRTLAAALPHIAYASMCAVCARLLGRLGLHARTLAMVLGFEPWLATGLPAVRTLLLLSAAPGEQRLCLEYWVVWASVELCKDLLHAIPFLPRFGRAALPLLERWWPLTMLYEIPFCGYLWLQLPGRRGLLLAYELVAPQLQRRASHLDDWLPSVPERAKGVLQMALAAAIGMERSAALIDAVLEGRVLLVGLAFLLMPSQVAAIGLPLIALGGPILRSMDAIASTKNGHATPAVTSTGTQPPTAAAAHQQLRYWLGYATLWAAVRIFEPVLAWVPFVTHMRLLAVLWLQLPIFRAATRLLALLLALLRVARRRGVGGTEADEGESSLAIRQPRANAAYASRLSRRGAGAHSPAASTTSAPASADAAADAARTTGSVLKTD